jgi:hypothetical protein
MYCLSISETDQKKQYVRFSCVFCRCLILDFVFTCFALCLFVFFSNSICFLLFVFFPSCQLFHRHMFAVVFFALGLTQVLGDDPNFRLESTENCQVIDPSCLVPSLHMFMHICLIFVSLFSPKVCILLWATHQVLHAYFIVLSCGCLVLWLSSGIIIFRI